MGRGYVPAEENRDACVEVTQDFSIDFIYTPIRNVKYVVEPFRGRAEDRLR